jgi:hypothetical protein
MVLREITMFIFVTFPLTEKMIRQPETISRRRRREPVKEACLLKTRSALCVQVANLTLGTLVALFDTSWMMHDERE